MKMHISYSGDKRIINRFLILPKRIRDDKRWLEFVKIQQEYSEMDGAWRNIKFID